MGKRRAVPHAVRKIFFSFSLLLLLFLLDDADEKNDVYVAFDGSIRRDATGRVLVLYMSKYTNRVDGEGGSMRSIFPLPREEETFVDVRGLC